MRQRPDVTLYLDPPEPSAGDRLHAQVRLTSKSETPYDAIDVMLVGRESRYKNTVSTGKSSTSYYHRREIFRLGKTFPAGVLKPGTLDQHIYFDIPQSTPPSYSSSLSSIEYELSVHVHIPWWPDRHEAYDVPIRIPARDPGRAEPRVFTTESRDRRGKEPVIELSLEDTRLPVQGTLRGAIAITGLGDRKLRRIELAASTIESAVVYTTKGPAEVDRRVFKLLERTPAEGESIPFKIAIPADVPPTFVSTYLQIAHALEVTAVVAFGKDLMLRVPVVVERQIAPARSSSTGVPLVGKQRHFEVLRAGVERARAAGFPITSFNPETGVVELDVSGVHVTVTEENRENFGPCLVAELAFAPLGLDVRLCERKWTDLGPSLPGFEKPLAKRFSTHAREPVQAACLFPADVRAALAPFDEAALDDTSAVVVRKGGVYQVSGLERFLHRVTNLAKSLAASIAALPPPGALAKHVEEWRGFAERHDASLRIGDLSVHGLVLSGIPLSIEHRFEEEKPIEVRATAPRPDRADPPAIAARIKKAMKLEPAIAESRISVSLPLVNDPEELLGALEAFAATVAQLSGAHERGPYR